MATEVQREVLREAGQEPTEEALHALRQAAARHPEEAIYVKFNRAARGSLAAGDLAPDCPLYSNGEATSVVEQARMSASHGKALVLAAGSYS